MSNVRRIDSLRNRIEYSKRQLRISQVVFVGAASMSGVTVEAISDNADIHSGKIVPTLVATVASLAWLRADIKEVNEATTELEHAISQYGHPQDS